MENKICVVCNTEKSNDIFLNKYRECKQLNIKRKVKRYYQSKDKLSNNQNLYFAKIRDKLIQKQKDTYINFKQLHRSSIEILNELKASEENCHTQQIET